MDIAIRGIAGEGSPYSSAAEAVAPPHTATPGTVAAGGADNTADNEAIKKMVEEIQSNINSMNIALCFSTYGENPEKVAIAITDRETGRVIREIPSKELQNLYLKMNELAGMIFNNMA